MSAIHGLVSARRSEPGRDLRLLQIGTSACATAFLAGAVVAWNPVLGLGAVAGAAYGLVALRSLPLAFTLWVPSFFFPFYRIGNLWLKAGLAMTVVMLAAFLVTNRRTIRRILAPHERTLLVLAGLIAWLGLSILWADSAATALSEWLKIVLSASVLGLVLLAVRTPARARWVVVAFVAAGACSAAFGLIGFPGTTDNPDAVASVAAEGRITAGSGDPNVLAASLIASAILAVCLMPFVRGLPRAMLGGAAALSIMGVAATQSRGGLIAGGAALLLSLVVFRRQLAVIVPVVAVVLATLLIYFVAVPGASKRVTDVSDSGNGRTELWVVGWRTFRDHPVRGVGLNQFRAESSTYVREPGTLQFVRLISERPLVVHNTYLQFLAETGIVGLAAFLWLVGLCLGAALRAAGRFDLAGFDREATLARGVFLASAALLAAGFFVSSAVDYKLWLLLGLGPALLAMAPRPRPRPRAASA